MPKITRQSALTAVTYAVFLFILYLLQAGLLPYLPAFGVKALVLPVAVVGIAMFEGPVRGGGFGLLAGILCDAAMHAPAVQCTLLFALLGLGAGLLCSSVLSRGFPSYFLLSLVCLLIVALVQMLPLLVRGTAAFSALAATALRQTVYSVCFTLPMYYLTMLVSKLSRD